MKRYGREITAIVSCKQQQDKRNKENFITIKSIAYRNSYLRLGDTTERVHTDSKQPVAMEHEFRFEINITANYKQVWHPSKIPFLQMAFIFGISDPNLLIPHTFTRMSFARRRWRQSKSDSRHIEMHYSTFNDITQTHTITCSHTNGRSKKKNEFAVHHVKPKFHHYFLFYPPIEFSNLFQIGQILLTDNLLTLKFSNKFDI